MTKNWHGRIRTRSVVFGYTRAMFEDRGYDGEYDQAEICTNGHVTNTKVKEYPDTNRKHCPDCGAATIQNCPACKAEIVGDRYNQSGGYEAPRFCTGCGVPYPWQAAGGDRRKGARR